MIMYNEEQFAANGEGGDREQMWIPTGQHPAILVSYVELGKHIKMWEGKPAVDANGNPEAAKHFMSLVFEFPGIPHTSEFPHTVDQRCNVSDAYVRGSLSVAFAAKANYTKYMKAFKTICGDLGMSAGNYVGSQFLISVHSVVLLTDGRKFADTEIPPEFPADQIKNRWANFAPIDLASLNQVVKVPDATGQLVDQVMPAVPCPAQEGIYTPIYDWSTPTPEAWTTLLPWHKGMIQKAVDFVGSPTDLMLHATPALLAEVNAATTNANAAVVPVVGAPMQPPVVPVVPVTQVLPVAPGAITDVTGAVVPVAAMQCAADGIPITQPLPVVPNTAQMTQAAQPTGGTPIANIIPTPTTAPPPLPAPVQVVAAPVIAPAATPAGSTTINMNPVVAQTPAAGAPVPIPGVPLVNPV